LFLRNLGNMENELLETLDKVAGEPGIVGCVFSNSHGLCIGSRGKSTPDSAGTIAAIMNQASKLGPESKTPVVSLDYGEKQCLIYNLNNRDSKMNYVNANLIMQFTLLLPP